MRLRDSRRAACGVRRVCSPRQAIKLFTVAYAQSAQSECKQVRAKPLALTDAGLPRPLHVGEGRRARRFHRSRTSRAAWRASHIGYARPAGLPSTRRRRGRRRGAAGGDVGRGRLRLAWDRSQPIPLSGAVWGGAMQPGGSHLARPAGVSGNSQARAAAGWSDGVRGLATTRLTGGGTSVTRRRYPAHCCAAHTAGVGTLLAPRRSLHRFGPPRPVCDRRNEVRHGQLRGALSPIENYPNGTRRPAAQYEMAMVGRFVAHPRRYS